MQTCMRLYHKSLKLIQILIRINIWPVIDSGYFHVNLQIIQLRKFCSSCNWASLNHLQYSCYFWLWKLFASNLRLRCWMQNWSFCIARKSTHFFVRIFCLNILNNVEEIWPKYASIIIVPPNFIAFTVRLLTGQPTSCGVCQSECQTRTCWQLILLKGDHFATLSNLTLLPWGSQISLSKLNVRVWNG